MLLGKIGQSELETTRLLMYHAYSSVKLKRSFDHIGVEQC